MLGVGTSDRAWRLAFIAGLILAPVAAMLAGYPVPVPQMPASWFVVITAGFLVGFGARLGGGCTSGHGVCGMARLSQALDRRDHGVHGRGGRHRRADAPCGGRLNHARSSPRCVCGFIFGLGLLISGMTQPSKVLGFLDIFGLPGIRASRW